MGASKNGGYTKLSTQDEGQSALFQFLNSLGLNQLQSSGDITQNPLYQQSAEAIKGFLPGGTGFAPIQQEAQRNFQQQTIPSILNSLGSDSKGSSALNQALAGAGQNLNSNLASQMSQMQLQAANQGANLAGLPHQQALQTAQLGLNTNPFAYQQTQQPFWQQATLAGINAGGKAAQAFI